MYYVTEIAKGNAGFIPTYFMAIALPGIIGIPMLISYFATNWIKEWDLQFCPHCNSSLWKPIDIVSNTIFLPRKCSKCNNSLIK
jgi:hypothetical protein